ncbi:MAG: hypothetical protein ACK5X6_01910, partial [Chryseotalea sp.]
EAYDKAIANGANDEIIYNNRGKAKLNAGMAKESISDFDRSISLKNDYTQAYKNRALANYSLNNFQQAANDMAIVVSRGQSG